MVRQDEARLSVANENIQSESVQGSHTHVHGRKCSHERPSLCYLAAYYVS